MLLLGVPATMGRLPARGLFPVARNQPLTPQASNPNLLGFTHCRWCLSNVRHAYQVRHSSRPVMATSAVSLPGTNSGQALGRVRLFTEQLIIVVDVAYLYTQHLGRSYFVFDTGCMQVYSWKEG